MDNTKTIPFDIPDLLEQIIEHLRDKQATVGPARAGRALALVITKIEEAGLWWTAFEHEMLLALKYEKRI